MFGNFLYYLISYFGFIYSIYPF